MDNDEYNDDAESHDNNSESESQDNESESWLEEGSDDEDSFDQKVTEWMCTPEAEEARREEQQRFQELQESIDQKRRARRTVALTVLACTQAKEKCLKFQTHAAEQLLPGVSNEITMGQIAPKLSWRDFHKLSSLSRGWCHAFQSRQIYDARLQSHFKETLVLLKFIHTENSSDMVVYSMKDNSCYQLPIPYFDAKYDDSYVLPIPSDLDGGTPPFAQCISVDGKLYILGGYVRSPCIGEAIESWDIHVWDLYGQWQWKKCAHMQKGRGNFGCGVMDGKIYVFGGTRPNGGYVYGSEVYDPKNDTWSSIEPMKSLRFCQNVAVAGEELVVYGGKVVDPDNFDREIMQMVYDDQTDQFCDCSADSLEFYHPVRNEWREVKQWRAMKSQPISQPSYRQTEFVAQGKVHLLTSEAIYTYDFDGDGWTKLQSCSFSVLQSMYPGANLLYDEIEEEYIQEGPTFTTGPVDSLQISRLLL